MTRNSPTEYVSFFKSMKDRNGLTTNRQLKRWVTRGIAYARSMLPKR